MFKGFDSCWILQLGIALILVAFCSGAAVPASARRSKNESLVSLINNDSQLKSEFISLVSEMVKRTVDDELQKLTEENQKLRTQFRELKENVTQASEQETTANIRARRTLTGPVRR